MQTFPDSNAPDFGVLLYKDQKCLLAAADSSTKKRLPFFQCWYGSLPRPTPFCFRMFILLHFPQPPSNIHFWPLGLSFRIQSKPCGRITNSLSGNHLLSLLWGLSEKERLTHGRSCTISQKHAKRYVYELRGREVRKKKFYMFPKMLLAKEDRDWIE